jgi:transcriptional regulator with XRE-family HTH domain
MERFEGTSMAAVGLRLELTRHVLGMAQKTFCARAKIAANTYNQIENGKKGIGLEKAIALCDAYDLTLDWIYRGDPSGLRYDIADAIKALKQARIASEGRPHGKKSA